MQNTNNLPIVLNFYGGPGAGKSTLAAEVFAKLKWRGVLAELALEFAKDLTWEENFKLMENQLFIFAEQYKRIRRLVGKVDVVITDSPLYLTKIYAELSPMFQDENIRTSFNNLVEAMNNQFNNVHYFIERNKPYVRVGRTQTEEEARALDDRINRMLEGEPNVKYLVGDKIASDVIVNDVQEMLEKIKNPQNNLKKFENPYAFAPEGE